MDINLTGQIWGMPITATLIQPPGPWIEIKDWLPSLTAIVVVILGGIVTFIVTFRIESNNRKYEFKKDTFIKLLDILSELKSIWYNAKHKGIYAKKEELSDLSQRLDVVLYTLRLSGTSDKVLIYIEELTNAETLSKPDVANEIILNKLIPELKNDLLGKRKVWKFKR